MICVKFISRFAEVLKAHKNVEKRLIAKNNDLRSLQADMRIKLQIAQDFAHEDSIYFPLNLGAHVIFVALCFKQGVYLSQIDWSIQVCLI